MNLANTCRSVLLGIVVSGCIAFAGIASGATAACPDSVPKIDTARIQEGYNVSVCAPTAYDSVTDMVKKYERCNNAVRSQYNYKYKYTGIRQGNLACYELKINGKVWTRSDHPYNTWTDCGAWIQFYASNKCPYGYENLVGGTCRRPVANAASELCPAIEKQPGNPMSCEGRDGNPINSANGNKYQQETDYPGDSRSGLRFERFYNSFVGASGDANTAPPSFMGLKWIHNYDRSIHDFGPPGYMASTTVQVLRQDGKAYIYSLSGGVWRSTGDNSSTLERLLDGSGNLAGWKYVSSQTEETELYDAFGYLKSITSRSGITLALAYSDINQLTSVVDSFGRSLTFAYTTAGNLRTMTDPAAQVYTYDYNADNLLSAVTFPDGKQRQYLYEVAGSPNKTWLTGITDENGDRYATFAYDSTGQAISSEHAGGVERYSLSYDPATGSTGVTDPLGTTRTKIFTTVQGNALVKSMTKGGCGSCSGSAANTTFDVNGNPASRTDYNGNITNFVYDLSRNLETSRTEAVGTPQARTITTSYHSTFRLPVEINEPGRKTTFSYDSSGNLITKTVTDTATSASRTWTWSYNSKGQPLTMNGPRTDVSDVTTYTYNDCTAGGGCGQIHTVTDALSHATTVTSYDGNGRPLSITDANGVVTELTYSSRGWLTSRKYGSATTSYDYDSAGQLKKVTLPDSSFIGYTYDAAHRLTDIQDNLGNKIHYTLDALGNRTQEDVRDPANILRKTQTQVFDALNRLKEIHGANTQVTAYGYDAQDNRTTETEANSFVTTNVYDPLNRLKQTTDSASGVSSYQYDSLNRLTSVTDPKGLITGYQYNGFGDLTQQSSPDTGITTYSYDSGGNRKTQTDARSISVTFSYDALNRVTGADYPGTTEDVSYAYDGSNYVGTVANGIGRLTGVQDQAGATTYTYDSRGNLIEDKRVLGATSYTTQYGYDSADRITGMTYPSGRQVSYLRDAAGRVIKVSTTVSGVTSIVADGVQYLPYGPMVGYTLGNGIVVDRTYDQDFRLSEYQDGTTQHQRLYYDARNNIEAAEDLIASSRSQSFGYDALSRLTSSSGFYGLLGYTYDSVGNRTRETTNGVNSDYTYPSTSHRLSSITGGTPASFTYDAVGNVTQKGSLTLGYSNANRLSSATMGGVSVSNLYAASGQRVKKTVGTDETIFFYDRDGHLIAELGPGTLKREYVWLNGQALSVSGIGKRPVSITDSGDADFSRTGTWTDSTAVSGYYGADYQTHAPVGEPSGTVILDDLGSGASFSGLWAPTSASPTGYYGNGYFRTLLNSGAFTWNLATTPGSYRVYVRWVDASSHASNASYTVTHTSGSSAHTINQRQGGGQWYLLGTYAFGPTASVQLSGVGDGTVIADAVRLIPVSAFTDQVRWGAPDSATYDVYARWPASTSHAKRAVYTVAHSGGNSHLIQDQQANGGQWNLLGSYSFSSPGTQGVSLSADPEATVAADAIRFVPVGSSVTQSIDAYFHTDHLGTPQKMTDAAQKTVWDARYSPFGGLSFARNLMEQSLRFPGQYEDAETGLYDNWFRTYDPGIGGYLQPDPLGLFGGDFSSYIYAKQNPLRYTDPTGEAAVAIPYSPSIPAPPPAIAIGAAAAAGYRIGGLIYPRIEPALSNAIDSACSDNAEDKGCEALYQSILKTCASLSGRMKFQCFAAASKARDQCYEEGDR